MEFEGQCRLLEALEASEAHERDTLSFALDPFYFIPQCFFFIFAQSRNVCFLGVIWDVFEAAVAARFHFVLFAFRLVCVCCNGT